MSDYVFKSKKGIVSSLLILGIPSSILIFFIVKMLWIPCLIAAALFALMLTIWCNVKYVISNDLLIVKTGFSSFKIPIKEISAIKQSKTVLAAAALSFDRLEIFYSRYDSVVISPVRKEEFILKLCELNPNIRISSK